MMVLHAKAIRKTYHTPTTLPVLKGIDLELKKGETLAIMGASGEGKSTLLHILGTLESPDAGELFIDGVEVKEHLKPKIRNEKIGFIFQSFHLLEDYSLLANVLMPAKIANQEEMRTERALELIEKVGLASRLHVPVKLLSGGEKQRVAIARALCNNPPLILADEPTGNLDHSSSLFIHTLLFKAVEELNMALLIVTHDEELANLCHRKLLLKNGVLCTY